MSKSPAARGSSTPATGFTPRMQDAQARNRDPYALSSDSESEESGRFDDYGHESYESTAARREAAIILDNPELLMMHAQARNETIPATRHYFTKQFCGYLTAEDIASTSTTGAASPISPTATKSGGKARKSSSRAAAAAAQASGDVSMADAEGSGGAAAGGAGSSTGAGTSAAAAEGASADADDDDDDDDGEMN